MSRMPDLIGYELETGIQILQDLGLKYSVMENSVSGKIYPTELMKRIVRQRVLSTGEVELLYSFDTYQVKKDSHL